MAVKTSWAAGDVLTAADLTDTFATKLNYVYATTAPTGATGVVWFDTNTTPPTPKQWNSTGSAWVPFSSSLGWAEASSGGTITTYTVSGATWKVHSFLSSSSLVVSKAGYVEALIVGGGGGGLVATANGLGSYSLGIQYLAVGTHTVTIGAGGSGNSNWAGAMGGKSSIGSLVANGGAWGNQDTSITTNIRDGSTNVTYASQGVSAPAANKGEGGLLSNNANGSTGIVVVRYRI